ncbi:MAG: hypothetical protein GTN40_01755 [Candidatus Aenigmarchaeota archaeon]|nr:hypothetical protein [Candidatus Aenigmarchaeota archaeon]
MDPSAENQVALNELEEKIKRCPVAEFIIAQENFMTAKTQAATNKTMKETTGK